MMGQLAAIAANTWGLFLEAGPWLLLGLVVAGLIKAWIPERRMAAWLGGGGPWPVVKAAFVGAPLPLCSCGVIPTALGLRRAGASRGSTAAFLIATPETGADSVGVSWALLGPFFTLLRPVAAIASGIVTGLLAAGAPVATRRRTPPSTDACCGSDRETADDAGCCDTTPKTVDDAGCCDTAPKTADDAGCCDAAPKRNETGCGAVESCSSNDADCCDGPEDTAMTHPPATIWARTRGGLYYSVTEVLDDIRLWLALGLVIAGVVITFVPPAALATYASGLPAMLGMLAIGVPLYVCATESTPLAAAMLLAGVAPGTVLVFLLAGPATNLATLGALQREFGWRFAGVYLAGIAICALGFGLLTDAVVGALGVDIAAQLQASGGVVPAWLAWASTLLLIVLAVPGLRAPLLRMLR